jgi:hypothetical protein
MGSAAALTPKTSARWRSPRILVAAVDLIVGQRHREEDLVVARMDQMEIPCRDDFVAS